MQDIIQKYFSLQFFMQVSTQTTPIGEANIFRGTSYW